MMAITTNSSTSVNACLAETRLAVIFCPPNHTDFLQPRILIVLHPAKDTYRVGPFFDSSSTTNGCRNGANLTVWRPENRPYSASVFGRNGLSAILRHEVTMPQKLQRVLLYGLVVHDERVQCRHEDKVTRPHKSRLVDRDHQVVIT